MAPKRIVLFNLTGARPELLSNPGPRTSSEMKFKSENIILVLSDFWGH